MSEETSKNPPLDERIWDYPYLPEWVQYVAQDADGLVYGYNMMPQKISDNWVAGGAPIMFECLGVASSPDWEKTLMKRPEAKE